MAGKQAFDNTNKGRFFLNERKTAKDPALSGPGNYNGTDMRVAAWINPNEDADNNKVWKAFDYLAENAVINMRFSEPKKKGGGQSRGSSDMDDDLPF